MLRKSIALFLTFIMIISSVMFMIPVSADVRGDVNGNGSVNSSDYLLAKRYVLGKQTLTQIQKNAADVDGNGYVDRVDYAIIKRIALGMLVSNLDNTEEVSISYKKSYTTNVSANEAYPDNGKKLTDGYVASTASYSDTSFCGYTSDVEVHINLGSSGKDISSFEISYLNTNDAGIYSPASVFVYGGNSSSSCNTFLGSKTIVHDNSGSSIKAIKIELGDTVDYSYIRFVIKKHPSYSWVFIDEVIVYGIVSVDSGENEDPYSSDTLTDANRVSQLASVTSAQKYNSNNGRTVISGGSPYNISCSSYDTRAKYNSVYLTNSQPAGAAFSGYAWVGLNMSSEATITLSLDDDSSVNDICGFAVHCFNRSAASIIMPAYVDISVSRNGRDYFLVGRVYAADSNNENCSYNLQLDTLVSAQYVKFTFPKSAGYLWIEEVEVYANRKTSSSFGATSGYLDSAPNVLGGAKDIALIYHNYGIVDEEFLLPYVAYVDDNGNVLDTMFDGFLFLPTVSSMYLPGSTPYGTNKLEDWEWMFNEIFKDGYNFDALDKTAEKVKYLLGKSSMKLKVYVTIPHLDSTLTSFGDIDGDGISENLTRLDVRVYVAKTFAERVIKEFNSQKYKNLELCGFYWFHESIDGNDIDTAKAVNNSFNYLGYPLFWIPYYGASGFLKGYDYGFDAVCLQPNYAFDLESSESRLQFAAEYAKEKGMCIEIEIADDAASEIRSFKRYMEYLAGGVKYGYMNNSLHMYYQGFNTFGASRESNSERGKLIYKYTYQFIKGTLDISPDGRSLISVNGRKNSAFGGTVNNTGTETQIYKLSVSPKHGSLSFAEDGNFVYYPNKNFKGVDTFTYQISNYLGWSKECTVSITVG